MIHDKIDSGIYFRMGWEKKTESIVLEKEMLDFGGRHSFCHPKVRTNRTG